MSDKYKEIIIIVLLIAFFIALWYTINYFFYLLKLSTIIKKAWEKSIKVLNTKHQTRKKLEHQTSMYYGEMKHKGFIKKIEETLAYSGIYVKFPKLTAESVVAVAFVIFLAEILLLWPFTNFIVGVGISVVTMIILYEAVRLKRLIRKKQIDDEMIHFLNLAATAAQTNNDIIAILKKVTIKVRGPLRDELMQVVIEAENGNGISQAIRKMINRVENKNVKDLLLNLDICSKSKANYKDVLVAAKKIEKRDLFDKEELRKLYRTSLIYILLMIGLCFLLFQALELFLAVDNIFRELWMRGLFGQIMLVYLGVISVSSVWRTALKACF